MCAGLSARPFFAAWHEVLLQLLRFAYQVRDVDSAPLGARAEAAGHGGPYWTPCAHWCRLELHPGGRCCRRRNNALWTAMSAWLGRAHPALEALPLAGPVASRQCTAPPWKLRARPPPPPAAGDP